MQIFIYVIFDFCRTQRAPAPIHAGPGTASAATAGLNVQLSDDPP